MHGIFGDNTFRNISQTDPNKFTNKFNPTIFDSFMIAIGKSMNNLPMKSKNRMRLLHNDEYQESIRVRTTNIDKILKRISMVKEAFGGDNT